MVKRRVALLCEKHLWGESLEHILNNAQDVEFIGPWSPEEEVIQRLAQQMPDVLIIAEQERTAALTTQLLEACPNLPLIVVTLETNVLRIYTSKMIPARSTDLIEVIRQLPVLTPSEMSALPAETGDEGNAI